jgi:hypothetical protein
MTEFFLGLWHGLTAPLTAIIGVLHHVIPIFVPWSFVVYVGPAAGLFYNAGFVTGFGLGIMAVIAVVRRL